MNDSGIDRKLVLVMAVATGLAVASNYYAQPLLPVMRAALGLNSGEAGLIVTVSQLGYAAGLLFILPLGDLIERRRLISAMTVGTALALTWMALSPSAASLMPAALAVGALSVVAQVLVPFAAHLASDRERGQVVGSVMSGLLLGILLARTAAGYIARAAGWRAVYFTAAALMLGLAGLLWKTLPRSRAETKLAYPALLRSVFTLLREEKVLRWRAAYGALGMGNFSVLWTSVAFLLAAPPFRFDTGTIGLFGLAGAAGAGAATLAGRLADRGHVRITTAAASALLLASWPLLWLGGRSVLALIAGIVLLDVAAQGLHISNQSEIYRLRPEARSRINSGYMTTYFAGGALGSVSSAYAYGAWGWTGVCAVGAVFGTAATLLSIFDRPPAHAP